MDGAAVGHDVGEVVQMEEPVHEVAANAELRESGLGIAHGGERSCLETDESILPGQTLGVAAEEPAQGLSGSLLLVAIVAEWEGAMGKDVRHEDLGRLAASGGDGFGRELHSGF